MKKMFLATQTVDAMFLAEDNENLFKEAKHFVEEESKNFVPGRLTIKEIKSHADIPNSWKGAFLWGTDDELTPEGFIQDPEYLEYLRLKKKFEDEE